MKKLVVVLFLMSFAVAELAGQPTRGENLSYPTNVGPDTLAWKRYPVEVYTNKTSVAQGDTIDIMAATGYTTLDGESYNIQVYRLGASDTLYAEIGPFTLSYKPLRDSIGDPIGPSQFDRHPKDYKRGCQWSVSYRLAVPSEWKSGLYIIKCFLVDSSSVFRRHPFVVRQAQPGTTSRTLYKVPISEYHAYSCWGGGSLYWWTNGSLDATDTVSFLRPIASNLASDDIKDLGSFLSYERDFIAWAEQSGYVMEYCSNVDMHLDTTSSLTSAYRFLVAGGHDEYCSRPERQATEARLVRTQGSNVAFLSANMYYWLVDYLAPDSYMRMWCHKDTPGTNQWRNQPEGPEAQFIGVQYDEGFNLRRTVDTVRLAGHWLFRGTGLENDNAFGFGTSPTNPGILGAEVDHRYPSSPWNAQVLTSAWVDSTEIGPGPTYISMLHESVYHEDTSSNARVFAGASQLWGTGLMGYDSLDRVRFRKYAANMMDHFSVKKYIGNVYSALLEWSQDRLGHDTVEIDGNVSVLSGKQLRVGNGMKVVVDSAVALFVDGELQIPTGASVMISGSSSTWGHLVINSGGVLRLKANSTLTISPSAYFVLEDGGDVVFESGSKLILNYATIEAGGTLSVEAGGTLQVQPDGQIAFGDDAALVVDGTLSAPGTSGHPAAFVKLPSASGWSGIQATNAESSPSVTLSYTAIEYAAIGVNSANHTVLDLENCVIDHANIGVQIVPTSALMDGQHKDITSCTFSNIGSFGLYIQDFSDLTFDGNTLTDNPSMDETIGILLDAASPTLLNNTVEGWAIGMKCVGGSTPILQDGHNEFLSNNHAVECDEEASPILGDIDGVGGGGMNSFIENYPYSVFLADYSKCVVLAQNNWWDTPRNPYEQFYIGETTTLVFSPWLPEPPGNDGPGFAGGSNDNGNGILEIPTVMKRVIAERLSGNNVEAMRLLRVIVASNATPLNVRQWAVRQLLAVAQRMPSPNLAQYVVNLLSSNTSITRELRAILPGSYLGERLLTNAMAAYERNIQLYPNSELERDAIYGKFLSALYNQGNLTLSQELYDQLRMRYADSPEERLAEIQLQNYGSGAMRPGSGTSLTKGSIKASSQLPTEFNLSQNYPNPFNPTTAINYDLPVDAHVSLKVYDVLGREVKTLVDDKLEAGFHSTVLDASSLASGVYLYRLETGSFVSVKKLVVLK